jgi:hypothetical protein
MHLLPNDGLVEVGKAVGGSTSNVRRCYVEELAPVSALFDGLGEESGFRVSDFGCSDFWDSGLGVSLFEESSFFDESVFGDS